jgi:hypothetical protein
MDKRVEVEPKSSEKNSYLSLKILDKTVHHSHLCVFSFFNVLIHNSVDSSRRPNSCIISQFNIVGEQEWFLVVDHTHGEFNT